MGVGNERSFAAFSATRMGREWTVIIVVARYESVERGVGKYGVADVEMGTSVWQIATSET